MDNIDYLDLLRAQAKKIGHKRNATHTRLQLQICAAELLAEHGNEKLNVSKICEAAKLTRAGFYLHYKNKNELIADLLAGLLKVERQLMPALTECNNLYEAIEEICTWYLNFQINAAPLYALLDQIHLTDAAVGKLYDERIDLLQKQLIYQLSRFQKYKDLEPAWGSFVLEMLSSAMYTLSQERWKQEKFPHENYIYDTANVTKMFARMLYQALLCEQVPEKYRS